MPDITELEAMTLLFQNSDEHKEWKRDYDENCKPHEEDEMVNASKYTKSDSDFLAAKEFIGQNIKVTIATVTERHFEANERFAASDALILSFVGKAKILKLNKENTAKLIEAYGEDTDGWEGHEVGLTVKEYKDFNPGWIVTPLDVKEPEFNDDIPF